MIERTRPEVESREVENEEAGTLPDGRYLLFDAGCFACTAIAGDVERETEGWLTARGLSEPAVRATLSKARPDWKHEPTFLEIEGGKAVAFTGLAMKARMLVGLGPRKAARVARIARQKGAAGIEMTLTATEEDPDRYEIESIKRIDRRTALKTMGAAGLAATLLPWLPEVAFAQNSANPDTIAERGKARVRTVRLSFRETMRRFQKMRGEDNRLRTLHKNMTDKGFRLVRSESFGVLSEVVAGGNDGAVIRELSVGLGYKKPNGQKATFSARAELTRAGSVEIMDPIRSDYAVQTGKRLDAYAMKDGRVRNVQSVDDIDKERRRLRRLGNQQRGSASARDAEEVGARSTCSPTCLRVAPYVIGAGCSVYLGFIYRLACGLVTGGSCFFILTALNAVICTGFQDLTTDEICAAAGFC